MSVDAPVLRIARVGSIEAPLPRYQTAGSAGLDLAAAIATPITLAPLQRQLISTGLRFALPPGYEGQVRPRSGLALKHGITVLNTPGTIDADYRGEVQVLLVNLSDAPFVVEPLMRIAQLVVARHAVAEVRLVTELDATDRGAGGYGSTGT
jgi:dUTP pyrophosphatase